jgi:uncharacterized protein YndB with AHSA1/START domain
VLECKPPRSLAFRFHHLPDQGMGGERASRVTFEIEPLGRKPGPQGKGVCLTLTHEDFPPNSKVYGGICQGWPAILSSLKTLLETGRSLNLSWRG